MAKRIVRFDTTCIKALQACNAKFEEKIKPEPWLHCLMISAPEIEYAIIYIWDTRKVLAVISMSSNANDTAKKLGIKGYMPPSASGLDVAMLMNGLTDVPDNGVSFAWSKEQITRYGKSLCSHYSRAVKTPTIRNAKQAERKLAKMLAAGKTEDDSYNRMTDWLKNQPLDDQMVRWLKEQNGK